MGGPTRGGEKKQKTKKTKKKVWASRELPDCSCSKQSPVCSSLCISHGWFRHSWWTFVEPWAVASLPAFMTICGTLCVNNLVGTSVVVCGHVVPATWLFVVDSLFWVFFPQRHSSYFHFFVLSFVFISIVLAISLWEFTNIHESISWCYDYTKARIIIFNDKFKNYIEKVAREFNSSEQACHGSFQMCSYTSREVSRVCDMYTA